MSCFALLLPSFPSHSQYKETSSRFTLSSHSFSEQKLWDDSTDYWKTVRANKELWFSPFTLWLLVLFHIVSASHQRPLCPAGQEKPKNNMWHLDPINHPHIFPFVCVSRREALGEKGWGAARLLCVTRKQWIVFSVTRPLFFCSYHQKTWDTIFIPLKVKVSPEYE